MTFYLVGIVFLKIQDNKLVSQINSLTDKMHHGSLE